MKLTLLLLLLLLALQGASVASTCPVLCATNCLTTGATCSECYIDFQEDSNKTTSCGCPLNMFSKAGDDFCHLCPISCETCVENSAGTVNCQTCIEGYELSNSYECIPQAQSSLGWVTKNSSHDVQEHSPAVHTQLAAFKQSAQLPATLSTCYGLPGLQWLGGYELYGYQTRFIKSVDGLSPHKWVNIRFQAVIIDMWRDHSFVVELQEDDEQGRNTDPDSIQDVDIIWQEEFDHRIRHSSFCGNTSTQDNLVVVNAFAHHESSLAKFRIRMKDSELTTDPSDALNFAYFGIRELFVRVGSCPRHCIECEGPLQCTSCEPPYVATTTGTCACDSTLGFSTGSGCHANCEADQFYSSSQQDCVSCEDKYQNCQSCTANECLRCEPGFFFDDYEDECVDFCPIGFRQSKNISFHLNGVSETRDACVVCPANCSTCTIDDVCIYCKIGYRFHQGQCIEECPDGHSSLWFECVKCPYQCEFCSGEDHCELCKQGYEEVNGDCLPFCPGTEIMARDSSDNCGFSCSDSCLTCFGRTDNECVTCPSGAFFYQDSCLSNCSISGLFPENDHCVHCPQECQECFNESYCTSCNPGHYFYDHDCVRQCPSKHFPHFNATTQARTCEACPDGCFRCMSADSCLDCMLGYYDVNFTCSSTFPVAWQFDSIFGHMRVCKANCDICRHGVCVRCSKNWYLDRGECVSTCPPYKYKSSLFKYFDNDYLEYGMCAWKSPLCQDYNDTSLDGHCEQCSLTDPSLVLRKDALGIDSCHFNCPPFFTKNSNGSCMACPSNCSRCDASLRCLSCQTGFVINFLTDGSTECVQNWCGVGLFSDSVQCLPCGGGCQICQMSSWCLTCQTGYRRLSGSKVCVHDNCNMVEHFYNSHTGFCETCLPPCLSCFGSGSTCTSCLDSTYYLVVDQHTCVQQCPAGYFPHNATTTCRKCNPKCANCTSFHDCTDCVNGFSLLDFYAIDQGECVAECGLGFWSDNFKCHRCHQDCRSCYGPSEYQCLTCSANFYLDEYRCVWDCSPGKYKDAQGHCSWCHHSCDECDGPTENDCLYCEANKYWHNHQCYSNDCPSATYLANPIKRECEACQFGCIYCYSPHFCRYCTSGLYLYKGWCYTQCPYNMKSVLKVFTEFNQIQGHVCERTCGLDYSSECSSCNPYWCTSCNYPFYLYQASVEHVLQGTNTVLKQCYSSCPQGSYLIQSYRMCQPCSVHCKKCSSYSQCTECDSGWNLMNGHCTQNCAVLYFWDSSLSICKGCHANCESCINNNVCLSCKRGDHYNYFLNNFFGLFLTCQQTCGIGYYAHESGWCLSCLQSCAACNDIFECTSCQAGYYLEDKKCLPSNPNINTCDTTTCLHCAGSQCVQCRSPYLLHVQQPPLDDPTSSASSYCVEQCPNGHYNSYESCQKCDMRCASCTNKADNCTTCNQNHFLHNYKCLTECPMGWHSNSVLRLCEQCPTGCQRCDNDTCFSCKAGYSMNNGTCVSACPVQTFSDAATKNCLNCSSGCLSCSNSSNCFACESTQWLYKGQCTEICPETSYEVNITTGKVCKPCKAPCFTCAGQTSCVSCVEDYVLNGTKCQLNCPKGFYKITTYPNTASTSTGVDIDSEDYTLEHAPVTSCQLCDSACTECKDEATKCQACQEGFTLSGNKCVVECPVSTYEQNRVCKRCGPSCISCDNSIYCWACATSASLHQGECVTTCPQSYYAASQTTLNTFHRVCEPCSLNCTKCSGPSMYECTQCKEGFFLWNNQACIEYCPDGTFQDNATKKCKVCPASCQICSSNNNCTECKSGFTLTSTNQCSQSQTCSHADCLYCDPLNTSKCEQCKDGLQLLNDSCVSACSTGYYSYYGACLSCDTGCLSCDEDGCSSCSSGMFLYDGECWSTCPTGTNNNTALAICEYDFCLDVNPNDDNHCYVCVPPYLLLETSVSFLSGNTLYTIQFYFCLVGCPEGTVQWGTSCVKCPDNCSECLSPTICLTCNSSTSTYLQDGLCHSNCALGTYPSGGDCVACSQSNCIRCNLTNSVEYCLECFDEADVYLHDGQCLSECPTGYYEDQISGHCQHCHQNCTACQNSTVCTACISASYLYSGQCPGMCPTGTYPENGACLPCMQGCHWCNMALNCSLCEVGYTWQYVSHPTYFLYQCFSDCPAGTYIIESTTQSQCSNCVSPCLTCISSQTCESCVDGKSFLDGVCHTNCPDGTYSTAARPVNVSGTVHDTVKVCKPCSTFCLTCQGSPNHCLTCHSGFILDTNNNCISNCAGVTEYYSQATSACYNCSSLCHSCSGPGEGDCLSCVPPLVLYSGKCHSFCPFGYYASASYECTECDQDCQACQGSATNCTLCDTGLYLQVTSLSGSCASTCDAGHYKNNDTSICEQCHQNCTSCFGPTTLECYECTSPLKLLGTRCVSSCPLGSASVTVAGVSWCQTCPDSCLSCSFDSSATLTTASTPNCSQCNGTLYLYDGQCLVSCPRGTYASLTSSNCMDCNITGCHSCFINSSYLVECTACQSGFYLLDSNLTCVSQCPYGFTLEGTVCVQDQFCDFYTYNGVCTSVCPSGTYYYDNVTASPVVRQCRACSAHCAGCSAATHCLRCDNDTHLLTDDVTIAVVWATPEARCVTTCPTTHYTQNFTCMLCPEPCLTCSRQTTGSIRCLSCVTGFYFIENVCLSFCPNGYLPTTTTLGSVCTLCAAQCASCSVTTANCTTCRNSNYNIPGCTDTSCASNQYKEGGVCTQCHSDCDSCFGGAYDECTVCAGGKPFLEGECVDSCPSGYVNNGSTCLACTSHCASCSWSSGSTICAQCSSPYVLAPTTYQCVSSCALLNANGVYYYQATTGSCQACSIVNCSICTTTAGNQDCSECLAGTYYHAQQCHNTCPSTTRPDSPTGTCVSCPANCNSCNSTACLACSGSYVLRNGACSSTSCPSGYRKVTVNSAFECESCSAITAQCSSCDSTGCLSCNEPYSLSSGSCSACINRYYYEAASSLCLLCSSSCLNCVDTATKCTSCPSGQTLYAQSCLNSCPDGHYPSATSCTQCGVTECRLCDSASHCSACNSGFNLISTTSGSTTAYSCESTCPTGQFSYLGSCFTCSTGCSSCNSVTSCSQCSANFHLYEGYCLGSCPDGTYSDSQVCTACDSTCRTCSSGTNCSTCSVGLTLSNGSCLLPPNDCSDGYYLNSVGSGSCSECFSTCKTCSGPAASNCLSCHSGYNLAAGVCEQGCSSDSYYNTTTSSCALCSAAFDNNCATCSDNGCSSCAGGYTLSGASCTQSCPAGTYLDNQQCLNCPNYCAACSSSTECTNCTSSSHLMYNSLCYVDCPDQTYQAGSTCAPCYQTCLQCSGSASNQCSSCISPYYLQNFTCVASCDNGYAASNRSCLACSEFCLLCTSSGCTSCESAYNLLDGSCRSGCPSGYYRSNSTNVCLQCVHPCLACDSLSVCTQCDTDYTLNNGQCASQCPSGQYYSLSLSSCADCAIDQCASCNETNCLACNSDNYALTSSGTITHCLPGCPNGKYPNSQTRLCEDCFTNCAVCTSASICTSCNATYLLLNVSGSATNECVQNCPLEYYASTDSCLSCGSNCNQCVNNTYCAVCSSNYYRYQASSTQVQCLSSCPYAYATPDQVDGTGQCLSCSSNCNVCQSPTNCTECASSNYALRSGECIPSNCLNCQACKTSANTCSRCESSYYLYNSGCTSSCPNGFYPDSNTTAPACMSCMENCVLCPDAYSCDVCITDYVFNDGSCMNQGLVEFGFVGNMSGFTSNITEVVATVYVATAAGPMAFGAMQSTYTVMAFCQSMYLLQGSTDNNTEMTEFLDGLSAVAFASQPEDTASGEESNSTSGLSRRRRLSTVDSNAAFLETNMPIFIIMGCFICFYIVVLIFEKYNESCCNSCPCLQKYMRYICEFMQRRFKYIYVDTVMWISYLPFLYFGIIQLKNFSFDSGVQAVSTIFAMVIVVLYPFYPLFIFRKIFDRSDDPNQDLANYRAITLRIPPEFEVEKGMCEGFECCPKEDPDTELAEMSLSPYVSNVVRPVYNEQIPEYSEFKYCSLDHLRLAYACVNYTRKFLYVLFIAVCPTPVSTLSALIVVSLAFIVYLIALKPKKKLYLVLECFIEFLLLAFLIFMLVYVIIGGQTVTVMSVVTHAIGFVMANSALVLAIVLNLMAYYTIFCCIVDLIKHLKNKAIQEEEKEREKFGVPNDLLDDNERISESDPNYPNYVFDDKDVEAVIQADDFDQKDFDPLRPGPKLDPRDFDPNNLPADFDQKEMDPNQPEGNYDDKDDFNNVQPRRRGDDEDTIENDNEEVDYRHDFMMDDKDLEIGEVNNDSNPQAMPEDIPELAMMGSSKVNKKKKERRRDKGRQHSEQHSDASFMDSSAVILEKNNQKPRKPEYRQVKVKSDVSDDMVSGNLRDRPQGTEMISGIDDDEVPGVNLVGRKKRSGTERKKNQEKGPNEGTGKYGKPYMQPRRANNDYPDYEQESVEQLVEPGTYPHGHNNPKKLFTAAAITSERSREPGSNDPLVEGIGADRKNRKSRRKFVEDDVPERQFAEVSRKKKEVNPFDDFEEILDANEKEEKTQQLKTKERVGQDKGGAKKEAFGDDDGFGEGEVIQLKNRKPQRANKNKHYKGSDEEDDPKDLKSYERERTNKRKKELLFNDPTAPNQHANIDAVGRDEHFNRRQPQQHSPQEEYLRQGQTYERQKKQRPSQQPTYQLEPQQAYLQEGQAYERQKNQRQRHESPSNQQGIEGVLAQHRQKRRASRRRDKNQALQPMGAQEQQAQQHEPRRSKKKLGLGGEPDDVDQFEHSGRIKEQHKVNTIFGKPAPVDLGDGFEDLSQVKSDSRRSSSRNKELKDDGFGMRYQQEGFEEESGRRDSRHSNQSGNFLGVKKAGNMSLRENDKTFQEGEILQDKRRKSNLVEAEKKKAGRLNIARDGMDDEDEIESIEL